MRYNNLPTSFPQTLPMFKEELFKLGYDVRIIEVETACKFIEKYHYSHNTNGINIKYSFGLLNEDEIIGTAIFGNPAMNKQAQAWYPQKPNKVLELRRMVLIDDTKRNAESFFLGKCLKFLKRKTDYEYVLSYSDPEFGHTGIVYKASNFKLLGKTQPDYYFMWKGQRFHSRTPRLDKPFARDLTLAIKSGDATKFPTQSKYIYGFNIKSDDRATSS